MSTTPQSKADFAASQHLSIACCYALREATVIPFIGVSGPTLVSRRPRSWAVEFATDKGNLHCGLTLGQAMLHALEGV